jgi:IS5 family transposase
VILDRRKAGRRITLGADKAYDVTAFVKNLRERQVTPHIAINGRVSKHGVVRKTAVDGRITRHPGYRVSQICRKRIEKVFGDQGAGRPREGQGSRVRQGRGGLHLRGRRLQPHPHL